jgi:hypothetical protein
LWRTLIEIVTLKRLRKVIELTRTFMFPSVVLKKEKFKAFRGIEDFYGEILVELID